MSKVGLVHARRATHTDESGAQRRDRLRVAHCDTAAAPYDEPILEQIRETVRRFAAAALRDAPLDDAMVSAEDIAQDTMITLHRRGQPEATPSLLAWTIGIAKLKLREAARRSRRRGPHVALRDDDSVMPGAEAQVDGVMQYVWLLDHLSTLDRMIVEWRQAGYTSREVADRLQGIGYPHMTANNVDQRFFRALKTLRARIFAAEDAETASAPAAPTRKGATHHAEQTDASR